eukprot:364002-Chlamydomonas_euryale.AAC.1
MERTSGGPLERGLKRLCPFASTGQTYSCCNAPVAPKSLLLHQKRQPHAQDCAPAVADAAFASLPPAHSHAQELLRWRLCPSPMAMRRSCCAD